MCRVLVVEDDGDTAASCAMLLRLWGHAVEVAANGPSALQAVQSNPPDVVLLDLAMPKMDGWQVAKQIRQYRNGKWPMIVVVSGYGMESDKLRSKESGIDLHLIKPVNPAQLEDLLKRFRQIVMPSAERRLAQSRRRLWLDPSLLHWSERATLRKRVATAKEMMSVTQALRTRLRASANRAERLSIRNEFCEQVAQFIDENERLRQSVLSLPLRICCPAVLTDSGMVLPQAVSGGE